jgi:hypothetical protein
MATVASSELTSQVTDLYTGTDRFYALLMDDTSTTFGATSTYLEIIENEVDPDIGGYLRQEFSYSSGDINTYSSGVSLDSKRVTFTHNGTPTTQWSVSHVAVVRAPGSRSTLNVKPRLGTFDLSATGTDTATDRVTIGTSDWALINDADRIVIDPYQGVTLPAGLAVSTYYYVKKVGTDELEFYTDEALTTIVDITGVSAGFGLIKNATGTLFGVHELASPITVSPTQSILYDIGINQGQ